MKKLFCLLLALALLMTASFALAEETVQARDPQEFPNIYFGANHVLALEVFKNGWSHGYSFSDVPSWETRTLSDGTGVYVMTLASVTTETDYVPMTAKLYFVNETLAAAVQVVTIPEGADASMFKTYLNQYLGSGSVALDLGMIGNAAELLGEDAHLEDGTEAWPYVVSSTMNVEGTETPVTIHAMLAASVVDNTLYVAEFPYKKASEEKAAAQDLANLQGYGELTAEEQNAVQLYAEFLRKQQNETLEQYIDFLLKKHQ